MSAIQHGAHHDGSFYLHKVAINGQTYSAYYDRNGVLTGADRTTNHRVYNVPESHVNVRAELVRIGKRYVGR